MTDFSKEFYQRSWGESGYYETFSYGVGIDEVCRVCLTPFFSIEKTALEIGSGGGSFTERMLAKFKHLTAIDVIKIPERFNNTYFNFTYIELPDKSFDCGGVQSNSIDFCFCYNVFCHLSNPAIAAYLKGVNRVLKPGGDFVFMLANYEYSKLQPDNGKTYNLGDKLPFGHFYQSLETLNIVCDLNQWEVISENMIPEHRDIIIHLRKK